MVLSNYSTGDKAVYSSLEGVLLPTGAIGNGSVGRLAEIDC